MYRTWKSLKLDTTTLKMYFLGEWGGGHNICIYVFNITYTTCKRIKTLRLKITQGKDTWLYFQWYTCIYLKYQFHHNHIKSWKCIKRIKCVTQNNMICIIKLTILKVYDFIQDNTCNAAHTHKRKENNIKHCDMECTCMSKWWIPQLYVNMVVSLKKKKISFNFTCSFCKL